MDPSRNQAQLSIEAQKTRLKPFYFLHIRRRIISHVWKNWGKEEGDDQQKP